MRKDPPRSDPVANHTCYEKEREVNAGRRHMSACIPRSSSGTTTASTTGGGEQHVLHGLSVGMACTVVSFAWWDCGNWAQDCHLHCRRRWSLAGRAAKHAAV